MRHEKQGGYALCSKRTCIASPAAQNYEGSVPEFLKSGQNNLLLLYEKRNRELNKVRNYIRAKRKRMILR